MVWCAGERIQFRCIVGTTALEDREKAIHDFNRKGSDVYVFLLSIRAAGRGLNLQVCHLPSALCHAQPCHLLAWYGATAVVVCCAS